MLLFCGIYFYVKGFNERRDFQLAQQSFDQSQSRLQAILNARGQALSSLVDDLVTNQKSSVARAEFEATGMTFALMKGGEVKASGVPLLAEDMLHFRHSFAGGPSLLALSAGHYLTRTLDPGHGAELVLLYPLADLERASRELLEAFLVAGLALLVLTGLIAHILAREISRPLVALRDRLRATAEFIGVDPPTCSSDEISEITRFLLRLRPPRANRFRA